MLNYKTLSPLPDIQTLTIGNFDGVHLGHKHVLKWAKKQGKPLAVLTFSNHPSTILRPNDPVKLICKEEHKLALLEKEEIDHLIDIPFTKAFSEQLAEDFLIHLFKIIPFKTLVLGHDATFGKDKQGDRECVQKLAEKLKFRVEYVPELQFEGTPLSSSRIRQMIQNGDLKRASHLLGRPYSILGRVVRGLGMGGKIGAHTANINVDGLVLPPNGVYSVWAHTGNEKLRGVANLGKAPTVRENGSVRLEVHLLDEERDLLGELVDVQFVSYIREEKKFLTIEELSNQIKIDIIKSKRDLQ